MSQHHSKNCRHLRSSETERRIQEAREGEVIVEAHGRGKRKRRIVKLGGRKSSKKFKSKDANKTERENWTVDG